MPLVKVAAADSKATTPESGMPAIERLSDPDAATRRRAARLLAGDPEAASALVARLEAEREHCVREALFASLAEIGGHRAAAATTPLLSSDDAGLRAGAVDVLKRLKEDAISATDALFDSPDPDLRIFAVEITRALPAILAVPRLRRVLESDPHINVCAAAVEVATEVGDVDLLDALEDAARRFSDTSFVAFAVDVARSRICSGDELNP